MQLPSHQPFPKKLRRPLAIVAISIIAITLLVIVFYFVSQPYVQSQLGPVNDHLSGRVVYKVPVKLTQDNTLVAPLFGGSESSDVVKRASVWSWRETEAKDTPDNILFAMGYSYVLARGAIPSDRESVIAQLKQSSQASIVSRVQTIADCKNTPAIKLYDFSPAGAKGFYYDYSCTNRHDRKLHGLVGFLLVDNSSELHLLMMLGRENTWNANRSRIATMLSGITIKKE